MQIDGDPGARRLRDLDGAVRRARVDDDELRPEATHALEGAAEEVYDTLVSSSSSRSPPLVVPSPHGLDYKKKEDIVQCMRCPETFSM